MELSSVRPSRREGRAWHGRVRRGMAGLAVLVLAIGTVMAQEDPGPCDRPTDKKLLKRLDEAQSTKNPTERHQKLKTLLIF